MSVSKRLSLERFARSARERNRGRTGPPCQVCLTLSPHLDKYVRKVYQAGLYTAVEIFDWLTANRKMRCPSVFSLRWHINHHGPIKAKR